MWYKKSCMFWSFFFFYFGLIKPKGNCKSNIRFWSLVVFKKTHILLWSSATAPGPFLKDGTVHNSKKKTNPGGKIFLTLCVSCVSVLSKFSQIYCQSEKKVCPASFNTLFQFSVIETAFFFYSHCLSPQDCILLLCISCCFLFLMVLNCTVVLGDVLFKDFIC